MFCSGHCSRPQVGLRWHRINLEFIARVVFKVGTLFAGQLFAQNLHKLSLHEGPVLLFPRVPKFCWLTLKTQNTKRFTHCFEHVEIMDNFKDALLVDIGEMFS